MTFLQSRMYWVFIAAMFFSVVLFYLLGTGGLAVYIHPSSYWLVVFISFTFFGLALRSILYREKITAHSINFFGVVLLFLVSLIVLVIKPTPLSVETAKIRMASSGNINTTKNIDQVLVRKTSDFALLDWLAVLSEADQAFRYEGSPVDITGFLLVQDGNSMVGRLVITCCGADAQPVVMRFRGNEKLPPENTWIRVRGTMRLSEVHPFVQASSVEVIPQPKNPYAE